jgi:hypothetical protein
MTPARFGQQLAIGVVLVAFAPPAAARAGTITFGAPLAQPPDVSFDCTALPLGTGALEPATGNASSCTWATASNPAQPSGGMTTPPGTGTVTAVRIRVGPTTGPMSLVVLEESRNLSTGSVACCKATFVGQPFMPTADAVNAFRTDLPVHTDADGQQSSPGIQVSDILGLSILNDAIPIPALDETGSGLPAGELPSDQIANPASVQGQASNETATEGYQLDMQADWVPGTPPPPTPRVRLAHGRLTVGNGYVHVPLRCRRDVCKGTISVASEPVGSGGAAAITYATGSFRIGQNLYRSIAVPLTADGKAAARRHERLAVYVDITYRTPVSPKRISHEVELRF